jgi:hypothetical protein
MNTHSLRSHAAAEVRQVLANWLALVALLALGIVWPPTHTARADAARSASAAHNAPAQLSRHACVPGIAR